MGAPPVGDGKEGNAGGLPPPSGRRAGWTELGRSGELGRRGEKKERGGPIRELGPKPKSRRRGGKKELFQFSFEENK